MAVSSPPSVEHKIVALDRSSLKAAGDRVFTGYASVFGDVDFMGDIMQPGCFGETLAARPSGRRPLLWDHNTATPIGSEIELREDRRGLKGTWRIAPTSLGDEIYTLLKDGSVSGLSIGFFARATTPNAHGGRDHHALDLLEVSVVSLPALDSARIIDVKSRAMGAASMAQDIRELGRRLADQGIISLPSRRGGIGARVAADREMRALASGRPGRAVVRLSDVDTRALVVSPGDPSDVRLDLAGGTAPLGIMDVLPSFETSAGTVTVPARTAAAGAGPIAPGNPKPSVTLAYAGTPTQLATIAGSIEITSRAVGDGGDPLARAIDTDLRAAVRESVEQQIVNGSGVSPQLRGIRTWPGVPSMAATGTDAAGIMAGIGAVATASKLRPDVVLVSVSSWAGAVESLAAAGLAAELRAQGVSIISTPSLVAGECLIGVSATAPTFYRGGITITSGHVYSQFVRNVVTMLAEIDACVIVARPDAWTAVTGLGA